MRLAVALPRRGGVQGYVMKDRIDASRFEGLEHILTLDVLRKEDVVHVCVVLAIRRHNRSPQKTIDL